MRIFARRAGKTFAQGGCRTPRRRHRRESPDADSRECERDSGLKHAFGARLRKIFFNTLLRACDAIRASFAGKNFHVTRMIALRQNAIRQ